MRKSARRQQKVPKKRRYSRQEKEKFAEKLRENMTPSEKRLWKAFTPYIRKGEMEVRAQVVICGYIADFWIPGKRVVVEVDGGIHKYRKRYDERRDSHMEKKGIRVLRYSNREVNSNAQGVAAEIFRLVMK